MPIDFNRARSALSKLAADMSRFSDRPVTRERAALGVIRVANANMERALRVVSVERGQDPRLFSLVSFGGAGGLHVCELGAQLEIPRVVVPRLPGVLSALGVLLGDVVKDYSRTVMLKTARLDPRLVDRHFNELARQATEELKREGFAGDRMKLSLSAAMRYSGQSFEIDVGWGKQFAEAFHSAHRARYGYADESRPTEIVSLRLRATGVTEKPRLKKTLKRDRRTPRLTRAAKVYLTARPTEIPVYSRHELGAGMKLNGPAIITEYSSTTLVPGDRRVDIDSWLNLLITAR